MFIYIYIYICLYIYIYIYIYIYVYSAKRMSIEHSFVIVYTSSLKFLKHE